MSFRFFLMFFESIVIAKINDAFERNLNLQRSVWRNKITYIYIEGINMQEFLMLLSGIKIISATKYVILIAWKYLDSIMKRNYVTE